MGAPPMVNAASPVRSAWLKRGWATMSWAMAGTTKATTGRRRSTIDIHSPASKRGWYHPVIPPRMGP